MSATATGVSGINVIFVDSGADMSREDIKKLENAGFLVVTVAGNPNQVTRRETFY